jgi:hypothetical protein
MWVPVTTYVLKLIPTGIRVLPNMDFGTEIGTGGVNNTGSGGYPYP